MRHGDVLEVEVRDGSKVASINGNLVASGSHDQRIKGPRSKIVDAILMLLYSRPMKSREIANQLGKSSRYIASYLSYWKSRGLVDYRAGYWFLTKRGEEYVRMLISVLNAREEEKLSHKDTGEPVNEAMNNNSRQVKTRSSGVLQPFIVEQTSSKVEKTRDDAVANALKCLNEILGERNLDEEEYSVLTHLVKHYAEWGSTYLYIDQIAEDLHYELRQLLSILRRLQTKKLIYMYADKRLGMRIGIGKALKQAIDKCLNKQNAH